MGYQIAPTNPLEERIIAALKTVHDPEIPVNIYELGLIYSINIDEEGIATIEMTLTNPACPEAETIPLKIAVAVGTVTGVTDVMVELTFDPPWERDFMSDVARVALNLW